MLTFNALIITLQLSFIRQTLSASSVSPVWMPNTYFETRPAPIKENMATSFSYADPITITIPFTKTYTLVPQLAFGIKNYRSSDQLGTQNFAITRTDLTTTGFTIYTMIEGVTYIRILTIIYLAVDRSFPYHLNVFNDIPANYQSGDLINITGSTATGERTYKNTINYADLATGIGSSFTAFGPNLAKCDITLFLCAIYLRGDKTINTTLKLTVARNLVSTIQFEITVTAQQNLRVDLIRFSIVAFDKESVEKSGKFTIVSYDVQLPATSDQFISIPQQFATSTLIGLLDFTTLNAWSGLEFNWEFDLANDRIKFNQSVPHSNRSSAKGGLTFSRVSIFYMKTWQCPDTHIYFNQITNMCDDYCAKYLYANVMAEECQPCQFGCYECINGPTSGCTNCNPADFRELISDKCQCKPGFYPNPNGSTVCMTCGSQQTECATCELSTLNNFACLSCIPGYGYTGTTCVVCVIPSCLVAVSSGGVCTCSQCMSGFTLEEQNCNPCSQYMPNCLSCSSTTVCTACDTGNDFYLNPQTNQCTTCNIQGCTKCKSLNTCFSCDTLNDYFITPDETCSKCILEGCNDCASLSVCSNCDETADYFMNSSMKCEKCSILSCTDCDSLNSCLACDQINDYFFNEGECLECNLLGCEDCQSPTVCSKCDSANNYFMMNLICVKCELEGCLKCQSLQTCAVIDPNSKNDKDKLKDCPYTCECNGYTFPKYLNSTDGLHYCSTQCGDELKRLFQQCDDGNLINGDGCSAECKTQIAWTCDSSCCTLQNSNISLKINHLVKIQKRNAITLKLELNPKLPVFTPENLQNFATLTVTGVPLFNESRTILPDQIIEVTYDYNQTIHGKQGSIIFELTFSQPSAPSCVVRAAKSLNILVQSNNNLPFMIYTEEELQRQEQSARSVNGLEIATFVIFFLSLIPAKINGLELIGVLQLAYFSLAQQQNVNALLEPFMAMKEVNGFNPTLFIESDKVLPDQVSSLGIKSLFLNNCNVMLALILLELTVTAVLFAVTHFAQSVSVTVSSVAKHFIKEGLLTLMMFNAFNITFAVGTHFHYADSSDPSYVLSSVAAIVSVILLFTPCVLLMVTESRQFGEFKNKLKRDLVCQMYFVFALAYRFVLGFYIAVKSEYVMSSLVMVGFSMLWMLYNLANLPFKQAYQNYRANFCHIGQLVILMVTNYYDSMLESELLEKKAYKFTAAEIEIYAVYGCVGISAICLVYDLFVFIKQRIRGSFKVKPMIRGSGKKIKGGNKQIQDPEHLRQNANITMNNSLSTLPNSVTQYSETMN